MPTDPTADLLAGFCFHALGGTNDALRAYTDALRYPSAKLADIHENIGMLMVMQHDLTNALPHFAMAVGLRPDDADAHARFGSALLMSDMAKEAVPHLREAIDLRPRFVRALGDLGVALERTGDFEGSLDSLLRALELQPEQNEYWTSLVRTMGKIYREGEIADLLRACVAAPSDAAPLRALAPYHGPWIRPRGCAAFPAAAWN